MLRVSVTSFAFVGIFFYISDTVTGPNIKRPVNLASVLQWNRNVGVEIIVGFRNIICGN